MTASYSEFTAITNTCRKNTHSHKITKKTQNMHIIKVIQYSLGNFKKKNDE